MTLPVLLQCITITLQRHGIGAYKEAGEKCMGNDERCAMCSLPADLCGNCRFSSGNKCPTNALPKDHLLDHGRYRIERVIGEGGYGITYEATDLRQQRKVAIKEFFPSFALRRSSNSADTLCVNPTAEANLAHIRVRFNQEASLLIGLKNIKEIVTVYHSFEENKTAYYTMELLQGMDMQKRLKLHGRMFWYELSPIVIQILRALYATHQMGYIHRDVTPDNIFLLDDGTVQLIDFGNARRYKENQPLTEIVKDKFAPREQYSRKGRQGPWTDIYSLCVTIYYAMTAVLPKKATEMNGAEDVLPPLHTLVEIPLAASRAIQVGMSADESKRYQSIADFAYALYPGQTILGELTRQFYKQPAVPRNVSEREHPQQQYQAKQGVTMPVQWQAEAQRYSGFRNSEAVGRSGLPMLVCVQGIKKGIRINLPVGQPQTIGRGPGKVLQYPDGSGGVSRNQCSALLHTNGTVYIRDDGSTYGTNRNGQKLQPGNWRPLKRGDVITFGREMFVLY